MVVAKRKITDYFDINPQAKKRIMKNCAKRGQIEDIFSRFPTISEKILSHLDNKTLASLNTVNTVWFQNVFTQSRLYWIRKIHKFTSEKCRKEWLLATKKASFEILKKLSKLAIKYHRENGKYLSLLVIVARAGDIDLFKYLVGKLEYNHAKYQENTPLHYAAKKVRSLHS